MNPPVATQRVLFNCARLTGLVPEGDNANLDSDKAYELLGFIDDRAREAWETFDFVETTLVEQRAFRPDWDCALCYNQGDIVWDPVTQAYYLALAQTTGGTLANSAIWQANPQTITPRWIPYWQTNKTPIGTCFSAWDQNPYENSNRRRIQFLPSNRGLEFTATSDATVVWLLFRIPYPGIGRVEWSASSTYNLGDTSIDGMDSYISSIDNNSANQPSLSPQAWTQFRLPWSMSRFVTQAAFSDSLIVEGQNEKAPGELGKAYGYLSAAYDQQELQQGTRENWQGYAR